MACYCHVITFRPFTFGTINKCSLCISYNVFSLRQPMHILYWKNYPWKCLHRTQSCVKSRKFCRLENPCVFQLCNKGEWQKVCEKTATAAIFKAAFSRKAELNNFNDELWSGKTVTYVCRQKIKVTVRWLKSRWPLQSRKRKVSWIIKELDKKNIKWHWCRVVVTKGLLPVPSV
jgi:hypothetical protein